MLAAKRGFDGRFILCDERPHAEEDAEMDAGAGGFYLLGWKRESLAAWVKEIGARREPKGARLRWANITAQGREAGSIEYARDWTMKNVRLQTQDGESVKVSNSERVEMPQASR
jgi:hypothetical protein